MLKKICRSRKEPKKTVKVGSTVMIRFSDEPIDTETPHLLVKQINTQNHSPQIEIDSPLGIALLGKRADKSTPIYYEDPHRGITGIYLLKVG
ncbi:MAG: hypothetical protein ABIE03_04815 [Patescibacteria group bacterium]|nr:GreA/GreB family elongation factor [Patescibacteria group bacterium]